MTTYEKLRKAAESGNREDIDALGKYMNTWGYRFWNGEFYDADGLEVYPVYKFVSECQLEEIAYTTDKQESVDSIHAAIDAGYIG